MKKRHGFLRFLGWAVLAGLVAALAVLPGMARSRAEAGSAEVLLSARAERGEITGTLSGGGVLRADEPLEITVPSGVEITGYLVADGERVTKGTPIASVDIVTVMAAAVEVQETLDRLAGQISEASNDKAAATLSASSAGRVKAVFVKSGDDVREAMVNYGCLAVISLDGMMSVEFSTGAALRPGEPVRVSVEGGKTYDGRVETILNGLACVTLTDNGPKLGDSVSLTDSAGTAIGFGTLAVHSPLRVIAESGTVNKVLVREGAKIGKDAKILTIRDMDPSAEYESLAAKRRKYTEVLQELFALGRDGAVLSPGDGYVIDIDESLVRNLNAGKEEYRAVLLSGMENSPETSSLVPEGTTNEVGMVSAVQSGTALVISLGEVQVTDYADLGSVGVDLSDFGSSAAPNPVPSVADTWTGGSWQTCELRPGDIVLIASGSTGQRLIFVRHVEIPSAIPGSAVPEQAIPSQEEIEAEIRKRYSEIIGGMAGGFTIPSFNIPAVSEPEEEELYDLTGTPVGSLIPDQSMKISFPVDELDVLRYSVGMDAEITVDALPGRTFAGSVTEIGAVGVSNGGNSKFTVTVAMDRTGDMLDGMNASVSVRTGTVSGIMIPIAALYDSGSRTFVYTALDRSGTTPDGLTEVTVGVSDGETAQILTGLEEGQTVWYVWYDSGSRTPLPGAGSGAFGTMPDSEAGKSA